MKDEGGGSFKPQKKKHWKSQHSYEHEEEGYHGILRAARLCFLGLGFPEDCHGCLEVIACMCQQGLL